MVTKKSVLEAQPAGSDAAVSEKFLEQAQKFMDVLNDTATTDAQKAEHLRAYHRLGALSRRIVPDHKGYGQGVLNEHAAALNRPYNFLSLARRFAERYEAKDLQQLCKQPLGVSHLRALVDVDDKRRRTKLQKQAYHEELSVAALFELKKQGIAPKRVGGALVKVAANSKTAILNLLSDGDAWVRRCEATIEKLNGISHTVPADLQAASEAGIQRLRAVAKAARDGEKALRRLSGGA